MIRKYTPRTWKMYWHKQVSSKLCHSVCVLYIVYDEVCPEGIWPCSMKNRDIYWRRYKIQGTLYIGQWHLSPLQSYDLLEEIWFIGSGLNQVISNCSAMFFLLWRQKPQNKFCHNTFLSQRCQDPEAKPQTQFLESPDQLLVLTLSITDLCWLQPLHIQHPQCSACCRPSRTWITFNRFSNIFEAFVLHSLHHPWLPSESFE